MDDAPMAPTALIPPRTQRPRYHPRHSSYTATLNESLTLYNRLVNLKVCSIGLIIFFINFFHIFCYESIYH
jgi:hypothetical protein